MNFSEGVIFPDVTHEVLDSEGSLFGIKMVEVLEAAIAFGAVDGCARWSILMDSPGKEETCCYFLLKFLIF